MLIQDLIEPGHVVVGLKATDKTKAIHELAALVEQDFGLRADMVAGELLKREALGSTAFGNGVAMPHARFEELDRPIAVAARLRKGVDFDAVDGQPVDVIVAMLLPASDAAKHLNALACVARNLRDRTRVDQLRAATNSTAFYSALTAPCS